MKTGNPRKQFDSQIAIIGGGPAGCSAAIWAAKHGLEVILIESKNDQGNSKPGETLHPGIEILFEKLGINDKIKNNSFLRHTGIHVKWKYISKFIPYGEDENGHWKGYQISRSSLDSILLEQAKKLGVNILQPCFVSNIIINGKNRMNIYTAMGNVECDFIIDAGGPSHFLAQRLGLKIEEYSPTLIAYYGYFKGNYKKHKLPLIHATDDGWLWIAKINDNLYQWTELYFTKKPISNISYSKEIIDFNHISSIKGANVTWRKVNQLANRGFFIIGDAALVLDPSSSHGIIRGIMSGIQVSHLINEIYNNKISVSNASFNYNNWMSSWFFHDLNKLKDFYAQYHPNPPSWLQNW